MTLEEQEEGQNIKKHTCKTILQPLAEQPREILLMSERSAIETPKAPQKLNIYQGWVRVYSNQYSNKSIGAADPPKRVGTAEASRRADPTLRRSLCAN